jgi:hypothetical protein
VREERVVERAVGKRFWLRVVRKEERREKKKKREAEERPKEDDKPRGRG